MISEVEDKIIHEIIETADFNQIVIEAYKNGSSDEHLAAYHFFARSQVPAGTAINKDIENDSSEFPLCNAKLCDGCMKCVFICPDAAMHAKVIRNEDVDYYIEDLTQNESAKKYFKSCFSNIKNMKNCEFILAIDPSKCKGCDECTKICGRKAINLLKKDDKILKNAKLLFDFFKELPETEHDYINKDNCEIMLSPEANLYTGGTNSCKGCNEEMAIKMMLAVTGNTYGKNNIGLVYSGKCELFYPSIFPYNPFQVTCVNSFTDDGLALASGIRTRWNQIGWKNKKIWLVTEEPHISNNELLQDLIKRNADIKILNLFKHYDKNFTKINSQSKFFESNIDILDIDRFILTIKEANKFEGISIVNVKIECQLITNNFK